MSGPTRYAAQWERPPTQDEIAVILAAGVAQEVATGAEAQLDLDRLETLAGLRMNASEIVRYLKRRAGPDVPGERG